MENSEADSIVIFCTLLTIAVCCIAQHWIHDAILVCGIGILVFLIAGCILSSIYEK